MCPAASSEFPTTHRCLTYLCEQIDATARRRKIDKSCILIGGEDEPAYVANFLAALRERGHTVARVSAREAKDNRENLLAITANLDLLGIAKTLLSRRARIVGDGVAEDSDETYRQIRAVRFESCGDAPAWQQRGRRFLGRAPKVAGGWRHGLPRVKRSGRPGGACRLLAGTRGRRCRGLVRLVDALAWPGGGEAGGAGRALLHTTRRHV